MIQLAAGNTLIQVQARTPEQKAMLEFIQFYFSTFKAEGVYKRRIVISLLSQPLKQLSGLPLFSTRMCQVFQWGTVRICGYKNNHWLVMRPRRGILHVALQGSDIEQLKEILVLFLLSQLGEALDRTGLHRLHAMAYLRQDVAVIWPKKSGGGKSTLAYKTLHETSFPIFSEESVLLSPQLHAKAFPTPISLRQSYLQFAGLDPSPFVRYRRQGLADKFLLPIPENRIAPGPSRSIFMVDGHWQNRFYLSCWLLFGIGNTQMIEFMVRPENLFPLVRIFVSRFKTAIHLYFSKNFRPLEGPG